MKVWFFIISIVLILLGGYFVFVRSPHLEYSESPVPQICCEDACFTIELAQTHEERQRWLMFRETLPEDAGMLFFFTTEQPYSFRMKNTLVPLDMLRLSSWLQVVDIQQADPCLSDPCTSYQPSSPAQYVLELNQGISKKSWIAIGQQCFLSLSSSLSWTQSSLKPSE